MWCGSLFPSPARPWHHVIPKHATPFYIPSVSATSLPRRRRPLNVSTAEQVGDLGHILLATLQFNPNPNPKPQEERKQEEGEKAQIKIGGSDVIWALQRASGRKKKNKQEQRKGSSSVTSRREESAVDYTNVRPLCINTYWGPKLDDLENRLRHLSDTI